MTWGKKIFDDVTWLAVSLWLVASTWLALGNPEVQANVMLGACLTIALWGAVVTAEIAVIALVFGLVAFALRPRHTVD